MHLQKETALQEKTPLVIMGIPFHDMTFEETVSWALERIRSGRSGYIITANLDFVMQSRRDPELQRIMLEADLVVADGAPLVWISRMFGPKLRQRVTGSDLTPMLAGACRDENLSIFALGAARGVPQKAMDALKEKYPGLQVAGFYSPPKADILDMDHEDILRKIRDAGPDLLLVAFGAPKQEKWINMHFREWQVPLAIGIGGTLDFLAGTQRRAPLLVQKAGMEWFWRMLTDPRRLLGRYASNLVFLARESIRLGRLSRGGGPKNEPLPVPQDAILEDLQAVFIPMKPMASRTALQTFLERLLPVVQTHSLVLDLSEIKALNSLELGGLVALEKTCRKYKGRVFLWNAGRGIQRYLQACGLTDYLRIVDTLEELQSQLGKLQRIVREGSVVDMGQGFLKIRMPLELTVTNLEDFRQKVDGIWDRLSAQGGLDEITIDAGQLEFIDSSALGFLVGLKKKAQAQNILMEFHGFSGDAGKTLKLARLDKLLGS
ncbi:WecB/TagA/CpsF family glycosyltransferase [Desulfonatronospira sp.]|uniref:WecB/TagA/CpsF family glycosyltransferase n=1 Tax=Desulfonatronospira sp. TaxID=1962951 RepID=UPI0025C24DBF|nr:WecB/TagA/CpsF family glycosyltransferase [Desulfonatronospira sp.]